MATATQTKKATKKTVKKVVKKKVVKKTTPAKKAVAAPKSTKAVVKKFSKSYKISKLPSDGLSFENQDCRSFKAAVDMKNRISPQMTPLDYRCSAVLWSGTTCAVSFHPKG